MAQAVIHRPVITEDSVRSQASPFEISGGKWTGRVFRLKLRFSSVTLIPPMLQAHLHLHVAVTGRTDVRSLKTL